MSRLTKFLKQTCTLQVATRNSKGEVSLNEYGEIKYKSPITLKCRRETATKDVQTSNGAIVRSSSIYYLDNSVAISIDDKLDGHVVVSVSEYINPRGSVEGYECYV